MFRRKSSQDTKNDHQKTTINLLCSVCVLAVNLLVSFFLSPYIIRTLGVEANGYISLAGNFTTYASLIVTALNAMAARFITFAYVEEDYKKANLYYNSVFWGNLAIAGICLIISLLMVPNLDRIINVPDHLVRDVKVVFALVFFCFIVQTAAPNWDCGTYISNRLDRVYIPNMITSVARCFYIVAVFSIWEPRIWFVNIWSVFTMIFHLSIACYNTHVLTPELKIKLKEPTCSWKAIKELVGSGIWNSISNAGNMLLHSVDLLICNLSLGPTAMGVVSLSKTIPGIYVQLAESIRGAFGPELTLQFARKDKQGMLRTIRRAMKLTSVILTIPIAGIIVLGDKFYYLWVPTQNAQVLRNLTVLSLANYVLFSGIVILYSIFTLANKVRYNSVAMMICGTASVLITLVLIQLTDWDMYAVVGVSCAVGIARDLFFTIPFTTKVMGLKWYTFYPQVGASVLCTITIIVIGIAIRLLIPVDRWMSFFFACGIIAILGLGANMMIILNREERAYLISVFKRKLHIP